MKLPLLISVPHAGLSVPEEVREICLLTPGQIVRDGDEGAREIYELEAFCQAYVTTEIARAVVDLNRREDDRRRDGVVKTHTCWNEPVYAIPPSEETVGALLERYYRPYHHRLREMASTGVRLGIDCHTMAAEAPPVAPDPGQERPAICLSSADGTLPQPWFIELAACLREAFGLEPALNIPFKGGHIIRSHAAELPWVQIEFSRAPFFELTEKRERLLVALRSFCSRW